MPSWKTIGAGCLMVLALVVVGGGCVVSTILFGNAIESDERPNAALITFGLSIVVATLLILAVRAITKEPEE